MELLHYWDVIRRRWWLPAALGVVALVVSAFIALRGANAYKVEMRLAVSTQPTTVDAASAMYYDPVYYANLSSEYLADDLSEVIKSESFAQEISAELQSTVGYTVTPDVISDAARTRKTHRLIDVTIMSPTYDQGLDIANAIQTIINDPNRIGKYLTAMEAYHGHVSVVNQPVVKRGNTLIVTAAEIILRSLVGVFVGVALALLVEYLDQSLRSRRDAEELLELPVLAEIPRLGRRALA
jgi:capsular polysaccharide biosynthesis protein